jgi:hypothetical protein
MKKIINTSIFVIVLLQAVLFPLVQNIAKADTAVSNSYTLLEPLPCIGSENVYCSKNGEIMPSVPSFDTYTQYIFNIVYALATVAAVFMIVWSGFRYVTVESFTGKSDAKKGLQNAVLGLILLFGSYLLLKTINPKLVEIPIGLVPKLDIKYDTKTTKNFFDALVAEIQANDTKAESDLVKIKKINDDTKSLRAEVEELTKQLNELKQKGIKENDERYAAILKQINATNDNINANLAKAVVVKAGSTMDSAVSSIQKAGLATNFEDVKEDVKNAENAINAEADKEKERLKSLQQPELISEVEEQRIAALSRTNLYAIKQYISDINAGKTYGDVKNGKYYSGGLGKQTLVGSAEDVRRIIEPQFQEIEESMVNIKNTELYNSIMTQIREADAMLKAKIGI